MVKQSDSEVITGNTFALPTIDSSFTLNKSLVPELTTSSVIGNASLHNNPGSTNEPKDLWSFYTGFVSAFINITFTFPINKAMFRQMVHGVSTLTVATQMRREGLRLLYRGVLPPLCHKSVSTSLMFGVYDKSALWISTTSPKLSKGVVLCTAASLAGCCEALLCPLERIQTVLQDSKYHHKYKNTLHCATALKVHGHKEFYRGFSLIVIRNSFSNILFFGLRDPLRAKFYPLVKKYRYRKEISDFLSGSFLGAFISCVVYPTNVWKTKQQVQIGGHFMSLPETILAVYKERGFRIFHGVHLNFTRAFLSWGIINCLNSFFLRKIRHEELDDF